MMLQLRLLRFEWLLQVRTLRFRVGVPLYLLLGVLPAVVLYFFVRPISPYNFGPGSYATVTLDAQRYLTVLLSVLVAGGRSDLESWSRAVLMLGGSPLSNAAILFRRWIAIVCLLVAIAALPSVVVLIFLHAIGAAELDSISWLARWAIHVVPIVLLVSMWWLALVTIMGSELGAIMASVFALGGLGFLGRQLGDRLGLPLVIDLEWLGSGELQYLYWRFYYILAKRNGPENSNLVLDTDSPFDGVSKLLEMLPRWSLAMGTAAVAFAIGMAFLRRTRRDLRPFANQEEHPLRTLLRLLHRFRYRYSPDAALRWERVALAIAVLALAGSTAIVASYHYRYLDLARERYAAETEFQNRPSTPTSVRMSAWSGSGELGLDGSVFLELEGVLRNEGTEPISELAWTSNPLLDLEISALGRTARVEERIWERFWLRLDPALAPGEETELSMRVEGVPGRPELDFGGRRSYASFVTRYEEGDRGENRIENSPLAFSKANPSISDQEILLKPGDLLPLLRYETWELTPPPSLQGEIGSFVRPESHHPVAELSLRIQAPEDRILIDSCGNFSREGILQSECASPPSRFSVRGGRLRVVETDSRASLMAFPGHEELARPHFEALRLITDLADRAWPGLEGVGTIVGFEMPGERRGLGWDSGYSILVDGNRIGIPEWWILSEDTLTIEVIANQLLARRLLERRKLNPRHAAAIEAIVATLMAERMGVGRPAGATITGSVWSQGSAMQPILRSSRTERFVFEQKVPALVVDMAAKVGFDRLRTAVERFLDTDSEELGSAGELLAAIDAETEIDMRAFYDHYFEEPGIPALRFEGLEVSPSPTGGYRVVGRLKNRGRGRPSCPVVVRAEHQEKEQQVVVEERSETEFVFELDEEPHTLLLDPRKTCFRWVDMASDRVERITLRIDR